jgi:hypothetical protein
LKLRGTNINRAFKEDVGELIVSSVSVFLFILFFQPFPLEFQVFNDRLLYVTGFGVITFILSYLNFKIFPVLIPVLFKTDESESGPPFFSGFIYLALMITAFCFYVRYVGNTQLSIYILLKLALICIFPLLILMVIQKNKLQEGIIRILREQNKFYQSELEQTDKTRKQKTVDIFSANRSEKLSVRNSDIMFIRSADNYIEVTYLEEDTVQKKLLRNTLKNIEIELDEFGSFIRCHRTAIINTGYIEKLIRRYSGYALKISNIDEKIPVSRQYLMQIKNVVSDIK